jgi:hypothetical protein
LKTTPEKSGLHRPMRGNIMCDFLESIRKDFGLEKFEIILQATDFPALTRSGHSYGSLTRRRKFT